MKHLTLVDRENDTLIISDSIDYLCYIGVNEGGDSFGVSPHHAQKIIEALKKLLKENK